MIVTAEFIERGCSKRGGWTKEQLELLGVGWPPMKGWKAAAIGREISDADAYLFLSEATRRNAP
jgi:hypothetical protein